MLYLPCCGNRSRRSPSGLVARLHWDLTPRLKLVIVVERSLLCYSFDLFCHVLSFFVLTGVETVGAAKQIVMEVAETACTDMHPGC